MSKLPSQKRRPSVKPDAAGTPNEPLSMLPRSPRLITGQDKNGKRIEVHHHGMEVHRKGADGTWYFFMDHPFGADPHWAIERPPHTD